MMSPSLQTLPSVCKVVVIVPDTHFLQTQINIIIFILIKKKSLFLNFNSFPVNAKGNTFIGMRNFVPDLEKEGPLGIQIK